MTNRISRFRSPDAAARYYELYDELVARLWLVPHTELDVESRFGTTHVRRSGPPAGEPLVLIHPTTGSSLGWHRLIAPLCERHPVYTPDTIGTAGRSVQTEPVRSPHDLSLWLDDVLDALGLETVHLLGYSEGGWIAGLHAAFTARPSRLATLTLVEPGGAIERVPPSVLATIIVKAVGTLLARDERRAVQEFSRWLSGDITLTEEEIDLVLMVFRGFRQRLPRPGRLTDEELGRIVAPVLVMFGADTRLLDPQVAAARARRLLPDVRVEITPEAGHGLPLQYPEEVTARILQFVEDEHQRLTQGRP